MRWAAATAVAAPAASGWDTAAARAAASAAVAGLPGRRPAEPEVDDEGQQGHHHEDDDERDDDGDDAAVVVRAGPGEAAQAQHHDQSPDGSGVCADAIWTWAGTAWTGMSTRVSIRPPAGSGTTGRTGG